ncbi:serine hydrolase domain-containing protein [Mucisphaera sp.]|uniref:serine hydrolase domain-containing protein n=1 Tax=Mucisphaera sp. TaxID=2913024 RepID=UPI003D0FAAD4
MPASSGLARLGMVIEEGIEKGLHLGAQVAVSVGDGEVIEAGFGELRPGAAMRLDGVLPWLSATKAVAAVAIAQLWELGRIDLDEPVASYVPEFGTRGKEGVTVRHVLTHTGGFRAAPYEFPRDDWATILAAVCDARLEPDWVPGEKAGYHITTGWFVLGELVQRVSGQSFPDYVRSHLFEPLGMMDSYVGMPVEVYQGLRGRLAVVPDTSKKAWRDGGADRAWTGEAFLTGCSPASNGCGPARELLRFYEALRNGGELDGVRILEDETVELFTARHRVKLFDHTFKATMDWGLGFILDSKEYGKEVVPYGYGPYASQYTFGHSGNQSSSAFADPPNGLAAVILWNGTPGEAAHQERVHRTLGALYEDLELA